MKNKNQKLLVFVIKSKFKRKYNALSVEVGTLEDYLISNK